MTRQILLFLFTTGMWPAVKILIFFFISTCKCPVWRTGFKRWPISLSLSLSWRLVGSPGLIEKLSGKREFGEGVERATLFDVFSTYRFRIQSSVDDSFVLAERDATSSLLSGRLLCSPAKTIDLNTAGNSITEARLRECSRSRSTWNRVCQQPPGGAESSTSSSGGNDVWDVTVEGWNKIRS